MAPETPMTEPYFLADDELIVTRAGYKAAVAEAIAAERARLRAAVEAMPAMEFGPVGDGVRVATSELLMRTRVLALLEAR